MATGALAVLLALQFGVHAQHAHEDEEHESCSICAAVGGDAAIAAEAPQEIRAAPAPLVDVALRKWPRSARPPTYHPRAPPPSH